MDDVRTKEIHGWIKESIKDENFKEFKIDFTSATETTENYLADIIYAKVTGDDKEVDLFLKMGKRSRSLRRDMPVIKEINDREIYFYEKILPSFGNLLAEKANRVTFDIFPKCYKTFSTGDMEVLVLENLKQRGYTLLNNSGPMNIQHIELVLRAYAKIHALSFALREQNKNEFNKLTRDYYSINKEFISKMRTFRNNNARCKKTLEDAGRPDLAEKYDELLGKGAESVVMGILDDVPQESVITHCDCHTNNILFKYEDENEGDPGNIAIIDWQLSDLHSPIMDVSFFLFCSTPSENLPQLDKLVRYYHQQLMNYLRDLGSDASEIFPFKKLFEHWKKYSNYGFIWTTTFTRFFFCDSEDAPSFEGIREGYDLSDLIGDMRINDEYLYGERMVAVVENHLKYLQYIESI